uniref:Protein phosphatase 1 regulatory subunit 19 n=1 Tax=Myotis lucifugus TaxID=59463 RepID=G1NSG4_MYOLU
QVVTGCRERIQHWQQVEDDYGALQERLGTLPDKLSYSIMVPFGPFAFMPGKLVHTNEVTVLLGDNWFAKCSAKQAVGLVEHRKGHVRKTIDDLKKVMTNFESRVEFTEDLQKMSDAAGDIVDIREEIKSDFKFKGKIAKHRIAHKPHSKPKTSNSFEADFANVESKDLLADQELWARLEELERQEELLGELESKHEFSRIFPCRAVFTHMPAHVGVDVPCSLSMDISYITGNALSVCCQAGPPTSFAHLCCCGQFVTGQEQSKYKHLWAIMTPESWHLELGLGLELLFSIHRRLCSRPALGCLALTGHHAPPLPSPALHPVVFWLLSDARLSGYLPSPARVFDGPCRENSVCSDTSEGSADCEERRGLLRSVSCEEAVGSDAGESILEEEQEQLPETLLPAPGTLEAFSGTVIEKELSPCLALHPATVHPVLPTIPERREVPSEGSEVTKRVSKFKAARLQ